MQELNEEVQRILDSTLIDKVHMRKLWEQARPMVTKSLQEMGRRETSVQQILQLVEDFVQLLEKTEIDLSVEIAVEGITSLISLFATAAASAEGLGVLLGGIANAGKHTAMLLEVKAAGELIDKITNPNSTQRPN